MLLTTILDIPLRPHQIPSFRAAFIRAAGLEHDTLHNHRSDTEGGGFHYRYATVQYRCIEGRAAIIAIGKEAAKTIKRALAEQDYLDFEQGHSIRIWHLQEQPLTLHSTEQPQRYYLRDYLALNEANYLAWQADTRCAHRIHLLERILVSHILKLATALHYQLPTRLEVTICDWQRTHEVTYKSTSFLAFDLSFEANIVLPDGIGIGKGVTRGFGVCHRWHSRDVAPQRLASHKKYKSI